MDSLCALAYILNFRQRFVNQGIENRPNLLIPLFDILDLDEALKSLSFVGILGKYLLCCNINVNT
jgi:hypothetical protein